MIKIKVWPPATAAEGDEAVLAVKAAKYVEAVEAVPCRGF